MFKKSLPLVYKSVPAACMLMRSDICCKQLLVPVFRCDGGETAGLFLHVFLFSDVTVEKLQAFIPQLLSLLYAEGLIHGNVTKQVGSLFLGVHPFTEPSVGHKSPNR